MFEDMVRRPGRVRAPACRMSCGRTEMVEERRRGGLKPSAPAGESPYEVGTVNRRGIVRFRPGRPGNPKGPRERWAARPFSKRVVLAPAHRARAGQAPAAHSVGAHPAGAA